MSKFKVGQRVYFFNSIALELESDEVYAVVIQPEAKAGKEFDQGKSIAEQLDGGILDVVSKYQLSHHQGILDEGALFSSESECRSWFRAFFAE